ncbi:GntR family transcriptional regulator [Aeromicrobium sp. CTD01-1L150]|uniref:GntR family transcriptional regulator n=1 Tax=Aeromicrobium sp. CTD01-1L150 TaxID=3341830 RepID=UPI0035BFE8BD
MTDSASAPRRATPAYRLLADRLRVQIDRGEFGQAGRLPTEAELQREHGVSRHTVREALNQLETDGLIRRVQGSGTFANPSQGRSGRYQRRIGSLDEIVVWPDTTMEVLDSFEVEVNPALAARLELPYIEVGHARIRRWYEGEPFVVTDHWVAPSLAKTLAEARVPTRADGTVIGEAEQFLSSKIAGARQDITAMAAPRREAELIGCEPGAPILLIERVYYDTAGGLVEMTASHFNPRRYSYRMDLRRRT